MCRRILGFWLLIICNISQLAIAQNNSDAQSTKGLADSTFVVLDKALLVGATEDLQKILHEDLLLGHSNAYYQTKDILIEDAKTGKIKYTKVENEKIVGVQKEYNWCRWQRIVKVSGSFESHNFSMNLSVVELWKRTEGGWQLWLRQSVKI